MASVKVAVAATLFRQGSVSLGFAARMAGKSMSDMMGTLAALGIPIVKVSMGDFANDLRTLDSLGKKSTVGSSEAED